MDFAIKITDLKKRYGANMALNGLNMTVPPNTIYGFLGENGAGKTTTFSILGGFLSATSGSFEVKGKMSMLPQDARFGVGRKIGSQLKLLAQLSGVKKEELEKEVKRVLRAVHMEAHEKLPLEKCSHGMYKRIGIAQSLLGNPEIVLLDEPTAGLDPTNAYDIRQLILELHKEKTVVVSSHNLAEIEEMCDYVGIINAGKMSYEGTVKDLVGHHNILNLELSKKPNVTQIKKIKGVKSATWDRHLCQIEFDPTVMSLETLNKIILPEFLNDEIGIRSISSGKGLEQQYLKRLQLDH